MKRFQIVESGAGFQFAGSKATQDVAVIARREGFEPCCLRMRSDAPSPAAKLYRQAGYYLDWKACCRKIPEGALVLLQHPFHYPQLTREKCLYRLKEKQVRFICLVHDVEELRGYRYREYYRREFETMLSLADVLIVHNEAMKAFFVSRGVPEASVVSLRIFDYLQKARDVRMAQFEKRIVIAGNLDARKSGYIGKLKELKRVSFDLYGGSAGKEVCTEEHLSYRGMFPADEPASYLKSGFGLVWDGDSLDGCSGPAGSYLQYNNPHKLSLYLSCGLPVILWEKAAEAPFVRGAGVGICIRSLRQLDEILSELDAGTYQEMAENAGQIGMALRQGRYTEQALRCAESIIRSGKEGGRADA